MIRCHHLLMSAFVALLSVSFVLAADEDAKPKPKRNANAGIFGQVMKLDLSEEQKEKVVALRKEFGPKLAELTKAVGMTKETRQARMAAQKEAKEKGLKGKELREFLAEKAPLTEEQQAAQKQVQELNGKIREKLTGILTEEQKEKLGLNKKAKPAKKKKKDAE